MVLAAYNNHKAKKTQAAIYEMQMVAGDLHRQKFPSKTGS